MKVTMHLNEARNGIELKFSEKPPQDILNQLGYNGLGFRWHNQNKYWFAKQTPERLAFARRLAGIEEEKAPKSTEPETYRYYSTQRPVDLGTYPKAGGAFLRFENFDQREPVEDGTFLAWGWLDYSRPLTEKEQSDYELRPAKTTLEKLDHILNKVSNSAKSQVDPGNPAKNPNTFAANYDHIGDIKILDSSDASLISFKSAYFKDLNLFVHRTGCGDCLSVLSLDGAGKPGKVCQEWKFYMNTWPGEDISLKLANEYGMHTVKDVWDKCLGNQNARTSFMLESPDIKLSNYQRKGMDVFSPFIEVNPLKALPEKWTKRNFAQALMSGQLFRGEVAYRYTDDYALDAANNFGTGSNLDLPRFVRDTIESWDSITDACTEGDRPDKSGAWRISYSEHSNSCKTLWFDLNCDIAEGKKRQEAREAGLRQFNAMLRSSCIQVSANSIDPGQVYTLQTLEPNNSGALQVKDEHIQGHLLRSRLEDGYAGEILAVNELDIQPDQLYQISNFHHRPSADLAEDDRVIPCGNWQNLVTGKALLELTAEGVYFPTIRPAEGEYATAECALATLEKFIRGDSRFLVSNEKQDTYTTAAERLQKEVERADKNPAQSLDSLLRSASIRAHDRSASTQNKAFDRSR